jgi:hypothetical protein
MPDITRATSTTMTKPLAGIRSAICFPVQDPARLARSQQRPNEGASVGQHGGGAVDDELGDVHDEIGGSVGTM